MLLKLRALPIINENDAVATAELGIGDNDTLAAHVAESTSSDLLVLLSDIDGLYTADPKSDPDAKLIETVEAITPEIRALAGGAGSKVGTGGMVTKLNAAEIATDSGCDMIITNGFDPDILYDIVEGKPVGTRFISRK